MRMFEYEQKNRNVSIRCLKTASDGADVTQSARKDPVYNILEQSNACQWLIQSGLADESPLTPVSRPTNFSNFQNVRSL